MRKIELCKDISHGSVIRGLEFLCFSNDIPELKAEVCHNNNGSAARLLRNEADYSTCFLHGFQLVFLVQLKKTVDSS